MNIAEIKPIDIANGPGVRVSVFVSGCTHRCPGCFNEVAWDFSYGTPMNNNMLWRISKCMEPQYIKGLTILGGEPLDPNNRKSVLDMILVAKIQHPKKNVWLYTGYTYEEIQSWIPTDPCVSAIMKNIDVLVDGPFVQDLKDLSLRFRGSSNQRIIDMNASRETGTIELWWDKDSPIKLSTNPVEMRRN